MSPSLSSEQADLLSLKIAPEFRREEVELIPNRWWDYRLLHPTVTTYIFAGHYESMHQEWWRRYIDLRRADDQRLWNSRDIFKEKDLTAIWLARQAADRCGCPYDFFCQFALERAFRREFRHPLRPNQLYGEEFELDLVQAWQEYTDRSLVTPRSEFYRVTEYRHHPFQNQFRAWLIDRINARSAPRYRLLARLVVEGFVSHAMLDAHWPEEVARVHQYIPALTD